MVLQSEIIGFTASKIVSGTSFTTEVGESTSVDYSDNGLDTVHDTITDTSSNAVDNRIILDTIVPSGTANGNDIDALLVYGDGKALNKVLTVSVAKTVDVVIDNRQQILILAD